MPILAVVSPITALLVTVLQKRADIEEGRTGMLTLHTGDEQLIGASWLVGPLKHLGYVQVVPVV